ncbi:MAG TPA: RsbRD N-terminal domain-containing protein [Candidatus Acidoferrum sp.]|nr:RsbRD N-terminal domain-containing protein [Candidatus Methylomirabilis sp.]HWU38110.1 RsbRD N-terminal domain-containing protein [Candidatus Acidoferrum sp.]
MSVETAQPLRECLAARRHVVIEAWLARTLQTYPEHTSRFLLQEKDPFRNPVGNTLKEAFPALFDQLIGDMDATTITRLLDGIVRIRAVQDFTASQAVAFLFLLKQVVREALGGEIQAVPYGDGLAALDGRIDEMALLAFDLFMKCRERMYEIKANEARRRIYVLERMYGMEPSATACGPEIPLAPRP